MEKVFETTEKADIFSKASRTSKMSDNILVMPDNTVPKLPKHYVIISTKEKVKVYKIQLDSKSKAAFHEYVSRPGWTRAFALNRLSQPIYNKKSKYINHTNGSTGKYRMISCSSDEIWKFLELKKYKFHVNSS